MNKLFYIFVLSYNVYALLGSNIKDNTIQTYGFKTIGNLHTVRVSAFKLKPTWFFNKNLFSLS